MGGLPGARPALLALLAGVLLGAFEGVAVGWAQGSVIRRRLPALPLGTWILATIADARIARGTCMLPAR